MKRIIVNWRLFTFANVALRYNAGDPDYAKKLEYLVTDVSLN